MPPSVCMRRSLGTGIIERPSSAISEAQNISEDSSSFVVKFRAITSTWLHAPRTDKHAGKDDSSAATKTRSARATTKPIQTWKTLSTISDTSSSVDSICSAGVGDRGAVDADGDDVAVIDPTTDLSYHTSNEFAGAKKVLQSLTSEEVKQMPDEYMPLRHYRAEKGDIDKAVEAIKSTLAWRKEFQVNKIIQSIGNERCDGTVETGVDADNANSENNESTKQITKSELAVILRKENETGKIYVRGYDKEGRALMYMRPGNENTMNENNNMRHLVFQIEKAVACSRKNGFGKICLVIDYEGFHISKSPPMSTSKRTLEILQRHYCERLHRAYICNPPFVFRAFYSAIKPFVDPITKQKVCFCVGSKGMKQIVDDCGGKEIAYRQLEKCCGGEEKIRKFDSTEYMSLPLYMAFDE